MAEGYFMVGFNVNETLYIPKVNDDIKGMGVNFTSKPVQKLKTDPILWPF